ncbi:MAG: hypothetical protein U0835_26760 [Isosphaeraceae bacterium]
MTFAFSCHECGHLNHAEFSWCGRSMHCGGCGTKVVVPAPREGKAGTAAPPVSAGSVKFACPSCGRKFSTKADLAGKKIKCGGCQQTLRIPDPGLVPGSGSPSAAPPAAKVPTPPKISRERKTTPASESPALAALDLYDLGDASPPEDASRGSRPRSRPRGEAVESVLPSRSEAMAELSAQAAAAEAEAAKKAKKKKKKKRSTGGLEMNEVWTLLGAACVGLVLVAGLTYAVPGARFPVGGLLCVVGFVVYLLGVYGFSKVASEEGAIYSLMCRFVPLYKWYYLVTRWDEMKGHFSFYAVGLMMLLPGILLVQLAGVKDQAGAPSTAALLFGMSDPGDEAPDAEAPAPVTPAEAAKAADRSAAESLANRAEAAEAKAWFAADPRTHAVWKGAAPRSRTGRRPLRGRARPTSHAWTC